MTFEPSLLISEELAVQSLYSMYHWGLSDVFSWLDYSSPFLPTTIQRKWALSTSCQGVMIFPCLIASDINPDHLVKVVPAGLFHSKVTIFLFVVNK